ncbi:MAG: hypothetical protein P4L56_12830 [Candidatus Sulfopaludibacter sp.]|nr:hypothetical protein [Candidatus Sulfopaludibacter sp.]
MNKLVGIVFLFGSLSATRAEDLSKYRNFQLGMNVSTVAGLAGTSASQVKTIHSRPELIQELTWRPQPPGASSQAEPAKQVVFSFYDGELYGIAVTYDRYETEGMTAADFVEALSAKYGDATVPVVPTKLAPRGYGEPDDVLAQWQDSQYRFSLTRSSFGSTYSLVGVLKRLEAPVQVAIIESKRLDDKEAPQREAARVSKYNDAERVRLEQARLLNKPKFRP